MAITPIGASGLSALEKAQLLGNLNKARVTNLVGGLPANESAALDSTLLNQIYDQKAITPKVRAAVAAKTIAAEKDGDTSASPVKTPINDTLIAANRAASSSEVPEKRPDPVVKIDVVS